MRKTLAIILLFLYTLTSTGATVYYHQCGNNTQISLSEERVAHDSCQLCIQKEQSQHCGHDDHVACKIDNKCCTDGQIELKSTDEQLSAFNFLQNFSIFIHPAEFIIPWIITGYQSDGIQRDHSLYALSSAPQKRLNNTYILVCNFRI